MNKYSTAIITFIIILLIPQSVEARFWEVSVFFDGEILREDREVSDVVQQNTSRTFDKNTIPSQSTPYKISIISEGIEMYSQSVNPQRGPSVIELPYMPMAEEIQIFSEGTQTASFDVSDNRTCYPNNICEYERGEDQTTCPSDCLFAETIQYSSQTQQTLDAQDGVIRDEKGTVLLEVQPESTELEQAPSTEESSGLGLLPLLGGLILIGGALGYWIYSKVRR